MKTIKLQPGAVPIKPIKKKVGHYNELIYDAKMYRFGLALYRVHKGFSGQDDREDWVIDVPLIGAAVCDYNWQKEQNFGICYGSFDQAILALSENAVQSAKRQIKEMQDKIKVLEESVSLLSSILPKK